MNVYKLVSTEGKNKNIGKIGTTLWSNSEIVQLLHLFGLPGDSPLSVLVVEILPTITNLSEHISKVEKPEVTQTVSNLVAEDQKKVFFKTADNAEASRNFKVNQKSPSPVSDELGHHRILRTSPLTEVPEVCCTDCE
jgi:hypothetical protein